jgi:hypothetical protein
MKPVAASLRFREAKNFSSVEKPRSENAGEKMPFTSFPTFIELFHATFSGGQPQRV